MAKKKWKKRLKKVAKAALIAGALYAGTKALKGRKKSVADTAATEDLNIGTNAPILGTDHITKKVVAPIKTYKDYNSRGINAKMLQRGAMNKVPPSMRGGAAHAEGYTPRIWTGDQSMTKKDPWTYKAKGGRIGAKKGGSVTGIAKRGFGRALMKGKK